MCTNDHLLWQAVAQQDDRQAFGQLFDRYYDLLCRLAGRLIGCGDLAEEIACDVLVNLWQQRHRIVLRTALRPYLMRAARNQSIDYLRQQARQLRADQADLTQVMAGSSPEEEAIFKETIQRLAQAISALPPQGQHIFRLSRDEGLKYREIADQLDISIKTVETHMRRSLIFLRQQLQVVE
jgi:RNA polymerase sigma-70 factor (ECF subfamily)